MGNIYVILFVCYTVYVYNRKCVTFSMPELIEEGLDTSHAGLIISCQQLALSGSKLIFGMLSDRIKPSYLFSAGLMFSGLTALLFSSSTSVLSFCGFWFLNGLAQGCGWPACAKILRQRADPAKFGTLWSILSSSYNVSGFISPLLVTYLALNYGWRYGVYATGVASVILSTVSLFLLNSSSNRTTSSTSDPKVPNRQESTSHTSQTVYTLLKEPFLWLLFMCQMIVICTRSCLVDWGQLYLKNECGLSLAVGSAFASSIEVGGFVGRLLAGYLTDLYVKRVITSKEIPPSHARMTIAVCYILGCAVSVHAFRTLVTGESTLIWIMCLGFVLGAFLYGVIVICQIASSESAPVHLSGSANSLVSAGGNFGSAISGFPMCYLAAHYSWSKVFMFLEIVIGLSFISVVFFKKLHYKSFISKKEQ